jgi:ABC-type phosphate transport system substrate-binding protein
MHIMKSIKLSILGIVAGCLSNIAMADVVVIVSAKNKVAALRVQEVSDIFLGKTSNIAGNVEVIPIDHLEGESTRDEFYLKTTGKAPSQLKAYWSKRIFTGKGQPPKEVLDTIALKKMIADNPNLIGYIDKNAVDPSVKVVLTLQ